MDAQDAPYDVCFKMVTAVPNQFVLFSEGQKREVCQGIATDAVEKPDTCGFITVSAYQVYNEYYQGLS